MIADLKPYPAMEDSGVEWLGEVPSHWTRLPGRACYREKKIPNKGLTETTVLSLSYGHIVVKPPEQLHGLVPSSFETYQIVEPGDIIVRPTDLQNDWNSLRFGLSRNRGVITSAYMCLYTEEVVMRPYGHLLLHTYDLKKVFYGLGSGLRQNLDRRDFKYLPCIVPPRTEQAAIVRYLDYADRRIRRYIRAKQKLVTLLEEQKQALIHQAVTGKVDIRTGQPYPAYKPSGVEWLGRVPEHWERRAVWQLFHIGRGKVTSHEYIANHSGSFPLYSSQTANDGVMGYIDTFMFDGDFLTWTTDGANAGTVFRRSGKFNCTNVCGTLFPKAQLDLDFMRMAIASETKRQVRLDINPKLMNNMMARIRVSVPPYDEQVRITKYVQGIAKPSDSVIERVQIQVGFLREYRTRLIADVVTGKLDVREAVARLPDEVEEPEPREETDALTDGEEEPTDDRDDAPEEAAV